MLYENIKKLRKQAHLTQGELGEAIGVGKSTISMYESGERTPSVDILTKMAAKLNTNTDVLLGKTKETPEEPKLSEGEEELLKLIRLMPSDMKALYLETLRATLKGLGLI